MVARDTSFPDNEEEVLQCTHSPTKKVRLHLIVPHCWHVVNSQSCLCWTNKEQQVSWPRSAWWMVTWGKYKELILSENVLIKKKQDSSQWHKCHQVDAAAATRSCITIIEVKGAFLCCPLAMNTKHMCCEEGETFSTMRYHCYEGGYWKASTDNIDSIRGLCWMSDLADAFKWGRTHGNVFSWYVCMGVILSWLRLSHIQTNSLQLAWLHVFTSRETRSDVMWHLVLPLTCSRLRQLTESVHYCLKT